jgi:hydrogenase/urease accessory protein HupE
VVVVVPVDVAVALAGVITVGHGHDHGHDVHPGGRGLDNYRIDIDQLAMVLLPL